MRALLTEIRKLGVDGFDQNDVERAKSHLVGTTRIKLQTNSAKRSEIAQAHLYELGLDFTDRFLKRVSEVTLDELRAIAMKYLADSAVVIATVKGRS